jgi:hypothetical protein
MDRECWFSVVMGEQFKVDARTTGKLARRVPLPASLANALAFRLEAKQGNRPPTIADARLQDVRLPASTSFPLATPPILIFNDATDTGNEK